jgi:hypothetical protein
VLSGVTSGVVFLAKIVDVLVIGGDRSREVGEFSWGLHGSGPVKGAGEVMAKGGLCMIDGAESEDSSVVE